MLTKEEAVNLYGSDRCQEHYAKNKKFKNKNVEKSLIKTLEQHFESVEIVKVGRATLYEVGPQRVSVENRLDNRLSNGSWNIPYTKKLDVMVISVLEQGKITAVSQTLSSWCLDFGLITERMYELILSEHDADIRKKHINVLRSITSLKNGEERVLNDYLLQVKDLQSQLAGALNRMKKLDIIEFYEVPKGYSLSQQKTINLHESTVKEIISLERRLLEKYGVDKWYIYTYQKDKKSIQYMEEWKGELGNITDENGKALNLKYWFKAYAIILKGSKKKIITYLERYDKVSTITFSNDEAKYLQLNELAYFYERNEHVIKVASKKQSKFLEPRNKNKYTDEYGGKELLQEPSIEDYPYDQAYYALYFERTYIQRLSELQAYYEYPLAGNKS